MNTTSKRMRPGIGLFNHAAFYCSWFRDGSHPDLGQLIHTQYSTKRSRLPKDDVRDYGINLALPCERERCLRLAVERQPYRRRGHAGRVTVPSERSCRQRILQLPQQSKNRRIEKSKNLNHFKEHAHDQT